MYWCSVWVGVGVLGFAEGEGRERVPPIQSGAGSA